MPYAHTLDLNVLTVHILLKVTHVKILKITCQHSTRSWKKPSSYLQDDIEKVSTYISTSYAL